MSVKNYLDEINQTYPVRKTEIEKEKFRLYVHDCAKKKGVAVQTQTTNDGKK